MPRSSSRLQVNGLPSTLLMAKAKGCAETGITKLQMNRDNSNIFFML
jgi:hypothetical protein